MKFREDSVDKWPIAAEPEEPLFEAIMDGRIEVANVSLDRGVHDDRNIVGSHIPSGLWRSGASLVSGPVQPEDSRRLKTARSLVNFPLGSAVRGLQPAGRC